MGTYQIAAPTLWDGEGCCRLGVQSRSEDTGEKPGNDHDMQAGEIGMGSFVYGYVTAQRVVAPPGESQASAAPAMATHIDTLAALVPAEALALYAGVVVPNVTSAVPVTGKTGTVISDPALLSWSCTGLLVLSAGLYIVGRLKEKLTLSLWDIPRALIPLAAFTCWMLVQSPGVFDVWWHGSSMAGRVVIAAFAAIVLGVLAKALGYQADQAGQAVAIPPAGQPAAGQSAAAQPTAEVPVAGELITR